MPLREGGPRRPPCRICWQGAFFAAKGIEGWANFQHFPAYPLGLPCFPSPRFAAFRPYSSVFLFKKDGFYPQTLSDRPIDK